MSPFLTLALLLSASVPGQEISVPAPAQPSPEEIAKAIRDLSNPKFSVRERASALVWSAGRRGEMALLRALATADLETTRRADKVLEKFRWGIFPDTPKVVLPLIAKYRRGDPAARTAVLEELFGRGAARYPLVARLLRASDTDGDNWRLGRAILRARFEEALRTRLRGQEFAGLEDLLAVRMAFGEDRAIRDYAVFLHLSGRIAPALEELTIRVALPGHRREAVVLAHLYRVKGDLPAARRTAEKAGDAELLQDLLVEQTDWKALSARADRLVGEDALPDFRAFYHRLAGDRPAFEAAVAELVKIANTKRPDDGTLWWEAKALFLNDLTDEALAVLSRGGGDDRVLDVLARQGRFRDALKLLDGYRDRGAKDKLWASLRRARLLNHLGEQEAARKLVDAAWPELESHYFPLLHAELLQTERALGRSEGALRRCGRLLDRWPPRAAEQPAEEKFTPSSYADLLLRELFKEPEGAVSVWWEFLRDKHARPFLLGCRLPEEPLATLRRLQALYGGKLSKAEFTSLVREARAAARRRPEAQDRREKAANLKEPPAAPDSWLVALADTCRQFGRDELLRECLEASVEEGQSHVAFLELAKYLAGKKRWDELARVCERGLRIHAPNADLAILHSHALKQLGRDAEARRLEEAARLWPLGDETARHFLAETLAALGRHDEARREFALATRSGPRMAWSTRNAWRELSGYAVQEGKELEAAACWEKWYLGVLGRGSYFTQIEACVWVPYRLHFLRARGLLANGDVSGALAEIRLCERLLPGETETAVTFVPALVKGGQARAADELFDRALKGQRALCADYPRCAPAHNALAWLAARCGRQLDLALQHARTAVRLDPDRAAHLDTLAEVHFRRGERAEAVRLMRRCIALAPDRGHYRSQLKRFEAVQP
jgi:tetratricopeptide (TPR) repeat protein